MKIHVRTKDFYSWFRIHMLKIGGNDPYESIFEVANTWDQNCHLKFGQNLDQIFTMKKRDWITLFEQYLESKSLKCEILDFWKFNEVRIDERRKGFNITLLVQFYGESNLDDLEMES